MSTFHLDTLWHENGSFEFVLTNLGSDYIAEPSLSYGAITRVKVPSDCEGAEFVKRQANYHEYRSPKDFYFAPGGQWRFTEGSLVREALHFLEGPRAGAVITKEGERHPAFTTDLQSPKPVARSRSTNAHQQIGLLPHPKGLKIEAYWQVPLAHFLVKGSMELLRQASKVSALSRRLHSLLPVPFVLAAHEGTPIVTAVEDAKLDADGYRLSFSEDVIHLHHGKGQGLFHGLISLANIHVKAHQAPDQFAVPLEGEIDDEPRHGWRGAHLDVSRQFYSLESVLRYVDILAWHKLNRFHWHLTDDEGWRLEINAYPELTNSASKTGIDQPVLPQLGDNYLGAEGYYSQAEARHVVAHAKELGIEVMPEIDLPGHSACVLGALPDLIEMEEPESYWSVQGFANNALNPAMEQSYKFAETVLDEVCEIFPFEVIHVGGDEVAEGAWMKSPKAQAMMRETGLKDTHDLQGYFLRHIQNYLADRDRVLGGWEEMAEGEGVSVENCLLFAWTTVEKTAELAKAGYDVIATPGQAYYLDMAQSEDWYETGASWAGFTPVEKSYAFEAHSGVKELDDKLKGIQACVWSEHLTTLERVNHQVFPRLSVIAESAWSQGSDKDLFRCMSIANLMPKL